MSRFIRRGTAKFFFATTVAALNAVTRANITAAEDITAWVADVNGWLLENNPAATPDMSSDFESSIPGTNSIGSSSLTMYEDTDVDDMETTFPKGTEGYVIIKKKGDKPASDSMDVFPVLVASKGSEYDAGNNPARAVVTFTVTSEPDLDQAVPAAV